MMNQWNDFSKDLYEMVEKNMELMEKFGKMAVEQNEKHAAKNVEAYFNLVEQNVGTLSQMWKESCKNREELREVYTANMKKVYKSMTKVYNETVEQMTEKVEGKKATK